MSAIGNVGKRFRRHLVDRACDLMLSSRHFRRTALSQLFRAHLAPNILAEVTFADHAFIVDPRDHMIAFTLLSGKPWQRRELDFAIARAQSAGALVPGKWFLDIGANIGTQTVYALLSGRFCGAVAIEADPRNAALLRRNIALNGLAPRVHVVEAAASDAGGTATLVRDAQNHGAHALSRATPPEGADAIAVATLPVDRILADLGIAADDVGMAMIDVEGHELEVLKGMAGVCRHGVPLVVELYGTRRDGDAGEALRRLLTPSYRRVVALKDAGSARPSAHDIAAFDFGLRPADVLIYKA